MKKLKDKLTLSYLCAKTAVNELVADESGDTNFISIAIILIVVLVIAVVFIGFGNKILPAFQQKIQELYKALGI